MADYPIRKIFQDYYPSYREHHSVTPEQESAAQCIMGCKTGTYGYSLSVCPDCGHTQIHNASCGNRNCPNCQGTKADEWVAARSSELIEGLSYFHVIATTPHELNPLFLNNPASMYRLLMQSIGSALIEVSSRKENLGVVPGFVSVLHTWGQNLELHPHVHLLVSGGGLLNSVLFKRIRDPQYLCPTHHLAGAFREKFLAGLKQLREHKELCFSGTASTYQNYYIWQELLTKLYHTDWNVFIKETFNGNGNAITYLARYAYRTAISNSRILSVEEGRVTIRWKDYKDGGTEKPLVLSCEEFIRRFFMHILPKHFSRIRYGGYLSNSRKKKCLQIIRKLTGTFQRKNELSGLSVRDRIKILYQVDICLCPKCQGIMRQHRSYGYTIRY